MRHLEITDRGCDLLAELVAARLGEPDGLYHATELRLIASTLAAARRDPPTEAGMRRAAQLARDKAMTAAGGSSAAAYAVLSDFADRLDALAREGGGGV